MQIQAPRKLKGLRSYILILVVMIVLIIITIILSHLKMQQLSRSIPATGGVTDILPGMQFSLLNSKSI